MNATPTPTASDASLHKTATASPAGFTWLAAGVLGAGFIQFHGWPLAEAGVLLLAGLLLVQALRMRRWSRGVPLVALGACLLLAPSVAQAATRSGIREAAQLIGILFVGGWVFRTSASAVQGRRVLSGAIVFGWLLSVGLALVQYAQSDVILPVDVAGLFDNRTLYGVLIAALLPLVLSTTTSAASSGRSFFVAAVLTFLGAISILHVLALSLFVAAAMLSFLFVLPGRARFGLVVGLLLACFLISSGKTLRPMHRAILHDSIAWEMIAPTSTQRSTLEMRAGLAAVRDAPLAGHGPGQFQATVSAGRYRAFMPAATNNKVERGTQPGYLVLAVEYGVLAAGLLAGMFGWLAVSAWRLCPAGESTSVTTAATALDDRAQHRAVACSLLLFGAGLFMTNLFVTGAGMIVAAVSGSGSGLGTERREPAAAIGVPLWQRSWLQGVLLALVFGGAIGLGRSGGAAANLPPSTDLATLADTAILLETENASEIAAPLSLVDDPDASGARALLVADVDKQKLLAAAGAAQSFSVTKAGRYTLWVRAWWRDGCGNSAAFGVGDDAPALVGNDGTYLAWHWVAGPEFELSAGENTLRVLPRESGARIDQILFVMDAGFRPQGKLLAAGQTSSAAAAVNIKTLWSNTGRAPKKPFRAAIGGDYNVGLEAFFIDLGVPYDRLRQDELFSAKSLAPYDLVWVSGVEYRTAEAWRALHTYVQQGGTAIIGLMEGGRGNSASAQALIQPLKQFGSPAISGALTIRQAGSPFLQGVPDDTPIRALNAAFYFLRGQIKYAGWKTHGEIYRSGKRLGPVFMQRQVGKGRITLLAVPLGHMSLRDDRPLLPIGRAILVDAIKGRYQPLFAALKWQPPQRGVVHFADDFMRQSGEGSAWKREVGKFSLTGNATHNPNAFSLRSTGRSMAGAGNPDWRAYAVSAAIHGGATGAGGIWLSTSQQRRLALVFDPSAKKLSLIELTKEPQTQRTLVEVAAPGVVQGWRRVSLLQRNGQWQGWLDGEVLITLAAENDEDAAGRFGVFGWRDTVYYDDVRVRDTAKLLPGRDVAIGEEGSSRAHALGTVGLEPRTIYAPTWFLRPDPQGRHAVRLALPTYEPAEVRFDTKILGHVPADSAGALVYLPQQKTPQRYIEAASAGWRDYTFSARAVDWYTTGSPWKRQPRWSCDVRWEFLGVDARQPSSLWYRQPLQAPYTVAILVAPSMSPMVKGREFGRDLNLVIGGDGKNPKSGYTLRVAAPNSGGCSIVLNGKTVAQNRSIGLPAGGRWALHHSWFAIKAIVEPTRLRFYFEGKLILETPTQKNATSGFAGFWTERNAVRIVRATIAAPLKKTPPRGPPRD